MDEKEFAAIDRAQTEYSKMNKHLEKLDQNNKPSNFKNKIKDGFAYGIGFVTAIVIIQFLLALIGGMIS